MSQLLMKLFVVDIPISIVSFEEVLKNTHLLIHIMPSDEDCLIQGTIDATREEAMMNALVDSGMQRTKSVILYGRNCGDYDLLVKKHRQLVSLGFSNIMIYLGGLFEWLLLQDIYGFTQFPTTKKVLDLLAYRSTKAKEGLYLTDS